MTRLIRIRMLLWLVAYGLAMTGMSGGPTEAPKLRVLMENNSQPFSSLATSGQPQGFAVELLDAIAADQGLAVHFDLRPWQQVYPEFLSGQGDILGLVAYSEERAQRMDFSSPFETLRCTFYIRNDAPPIRNPADLSGRHIGVIAGSIVDEFAQKQSWPCTLIKFPTLGECLAATQEGRVDATLSMQFVTDYMIRSRGVNGLQRTEYVPPGLQYSLAFAVQPGQKRLLARINAGLLQAQRSGAYDRLYEKWLGPLEPRRLKWRDVQPFLPLLAAIVIAVLGVFVWQRRLLSRLSHQTRALRESEERLRLVFEGSRDAFWDWDVGTGRIMRSPWWAGMLGYTPEEIGLNRQAFMDLVHPEDHTVVDTHDSRIWNGQDHFVRELRMKAKTGEWRWIMDRGKVVTRNAATGAPLRITGTHTDITERKLAAEEAEKLQHKMQETQKLESLGVLAGGIAHDFNNLLTVVLGNSALARLESTDSPVNAARLDSVLTAANRAAELCRQLLAYAGKGSYTIERLSLNEVVAETTRLLELSISKQARLEFNLAPGLPKIEADPSQVRQVIMNLVMNASEALEHKPGTIRIHSSQVRLPTPGLEPGRPLTELEPGDYVCVEVADSGSGMPPEVLARIFDPFFTTKFTGRGLGLAAVLGIVRTHRGALRVESNPGRGSAFRIYLPVSSNQTTPPFPV
jgi:PAS domain S-box-containing protein